MFVGAIEWGKLLQVGWVSLLAGIGVTLIYSLIIYAGSRSAEARRTGNAAAATAFGGLAIVSVLAFVAGVGFGVAIILTK